MRVVLQDLKKGKTWLERIPLPQPGRGEILVRNHRSLLSPGTERMLVDFGRSSLLGKARAQPERVRQVLDKARTDGWRPTLEAVRSKLGDPIPMGYCTAGVVEDSNGSSLPVGTRVATNGHHGEFCLVGENLLAPIPDGVSDDAAAFVPLASISLQGVRLAAPTLGETVFVMGLGLVGLLAVQLLRANGCRVLASDLIPERLALAKTFGAIPVDLNAGADPITTAMELTGGHGVDAVLVAVATKSKIPMKQAAAMARQRGRIVLLGVAYLDFDRDPFFRKELIFQVSCSYGPGRYDNQYETGLADYPIGHVRWTIQRNFEAVLALMADGKLDPLPLITHRFPFDDATSAYNLLSSEKSPLGVILDYEHQTGRKEKSRLISLQSGRGKGEEEAVLGIIGAGGFSRRVILPVLEKLACRRKVIISRRGITATVAGKKFGFESASSNPRHALEDDSINVLFVTTRHDTHASLALEGLRKGKHVFVEKPLALTIEELAQLANELEKPDVPRLMVGFNRRFSPHLERVRAWRFRHGGPVVMDYLVNAGSLEKNAWQTDPDEGGGRIIGEICHFVDAVTWVAASPPVSIQATGTKREGRLESDSVSIILTMEDGSLATINYWASGPPDFPKERLTAMAGGQGTEIFNFRRTTFHGSREARDFRTPSQDKGHRAEVSQFLAAIKSGNPTPIPEEESILVTLVTFAIMEALKTGQRQEVSHWRERLEQKRNEDA